MAAPLDAPCDLGRGAIVLPNQAAPALLAGAQRIRVDANTLRHDHPTINELHKAWASRTHVVVELALDPSELQHDEYTNEPATSLGLHYLFPLERLRFLVWANNVDFRFVTPESPYGRWWHSTRATKMANVLPAALDEAGDIRLGDQGLVWIDGGPRDAISVPGRVIHREDMEQGRMPLVGINADPVLLDTLTPDQQHAITAGHGAIRVPAPAGSGKTRVLSARLATVLGARNCPPEGVLALVYNTRAAEELRERVGIPQVTINTVHAHAYGLLRRHIPDMRVLEEREVRSALSNLVDIPKKANTDPIGPWIDAFDIIRASLQDPVEAGKTLFADLPDFAQHFVTYRQHLRESHRVDFAEMVPWATDLLLANPQIRAAEQRKAAQVLVDEFQDLTPAYLLYIRLLASPQLAVFGVGDDDQVIYGHAGANPRFLIDFDQFFPGATSHSLTINHRCPADVITKVNTLLAHNQQRIPKIIQPGSQASTTPVTVHEVSPEAEAETVVSVISDLIDAGEQPTDIAVLTRVNVALLPVQAALTKAGIPLKSPITPGLLDRSGVRAALTYLRLGIDEEMAGSDLAEILHRPLRSIPGSVKDLLSGKRWTIEELQDFPTSFTPFQLNAWRSFIQDLRLLRQIATTQPTAEVLRHIVVDIDLGGVAKDLEESRAMPGASTHTDDLASLILVAEYCQEAADFEHFLQRVLNPPATFGQAAVTLSSIHKVKGLEWPNVLIVGANEGIMPHRMAQQPEWIEEERRVFHVAITRAKQRLDIITQRGHVSRFIKEMKGEASIAQTQTKAKPSLPTPSKSKRNALPDVRAVLGLQVKIAGGLTGEIVEISENQIFLSTQSRAILRVPVGSTVRVNNKRVRLTLP